MILDLLGSADLDAALALSSGEGWNQTLADWARMIHLEPGGCFAARAGGRLAGTVTTTTYGRALAWIGMMVVDPDHRRRGVGGALMRRALDHLDALGVATVKLDATPAGRPLYESLGFVAEVEIERWQGVAAVGREGEARRAAGGDATAEGEEAVDPVEDRRRGDGAPVQAMHALDRDAYRVDRARLIDALAAEAAAAIVLTGRGAPAAYALARRGRVAAYLGPLVAVESDAARRALDGVLARLAGTEVCLDLHRGGRLQASALAGRGLARRRVLTRMRFGAPSDAAVGPAICAGAGPEFG